MSSLLELAAPARWGRNFRLLLAAAWTTNLADGVLRTAMPLLTAQLTSDPVLIALTFSLSDLAALLFGLFMGVLADRYDRRRLLILGNVIRVVLLAVLTAAIATGQVTIAMVLIAVFLLAIAETLEDSVAVTLTPMIVPSADLGAAATRSQFGYITMNNFIGPSVGALLFAVAWAAPYELSLLLLTLGAALVYLMRLDARPRAPRTALAREDHQRPDDTQPDADPEPQRSRRSLGAAIRVVSAEIADGVRWTWHHDAVRTLAVVIFAFNLTFGASWAMLVLYARDQLHLPTQGYGLLLSASAAGGVLGTVVFSQLERQFALATLLRIGLVIETLTHLVLALTTSAVVAGATLFVFGVHASVWGALSTAVRQRATPRELQGRVGSVYRIAVFGGMLLGGLIGGVIARYGGIAAPYWFGFVGSAVILAATWRAIGHIAHSDDDLRETAHDISADEETTP